MKIHLSDPDNRDDSGASFEFAGSRVRVMAYLDGSLRRDVRAGSTHYMDEAIAALKSGDFEKAEAAAQNVGIYLREEA